MRSGTKFDSGPGRRTRDTGVASRPRLHGKQPVGDGRLFADKPVKLRPHFNAHQVLALAAKQLSAGAIGITCARLEHAEALLLHGITQVLVANEIAGESMIKRFIDISRQASVILAVDNALVVSDWPAWQAITFVISTWSWTWTWD